MTDWWELLSGFEDGSFEADGWYADVGGFGFQIVDTEYHAGTHSAEPLTTGIAGLMHDLTCEPTLFYELRLWFKIVGTVPTGGGADIIARLFLSDDSDVQVYIATGDGHENPYLYCIYLANYDLGTTDITLNEWHLLHIKQFVLNGTAQTLVYLDDLETPELTMVNDLSGLNVATVEVQNIYWTSPYTGKVYVDSVIGSCDFWDEDDIPDGDGDGEETSLVARVESVQVKDVTLKGVQTATWRDSDPWVQIPIPAGPMLHHHLKPNLIEGTITCYDATTIWEAFYTSGIINESTGEKTKFSTDGTEFIITLKDIEGNNLVFSFYDVRITTIDLANAELESGGEGLWTIRFTARKVIKG